MQQDLFFFQTLLERLAEGPVIGDGGFVFALEKRGYVKAGPWTPEAAVEHPDAGELKIFYNQHNSIHVLILIHTVHLTNHFKSLKTHYKGHVTDGPFCHRNTGIVPSLRLTNVRTCIPFYICFCGKVRHFAS